MKAQLGFLLFFVATISLSAQVKWTGGFPGHETDWNFARNWSDNRIPNDLDNVVIPDCSTHGNFYPVIQAKTARVQSLVIESGASVTIKEKAQLAVLGYGLPGGSLDNLGTLQNNGTLEVVEPELHAVNFSGNGTLIHFRSDLKPDTCDVACE